MKNKIRYTILTLVALGLTMGQSHADDEAIAAIGGFLAGIITGAVIEDHHDYHRDSNVHVSVGHSGRYDRGARCSTHGRHGCNTCYNGSSYRSGHWEVRHVRVWVPGHWEFVCNRYGERVRVWNSGYYKTRPQRVWVSYQRRGHRDSYCG